MFLLACSPDTVAEGEGRSYTINGKTFQTEAGLDSIVQSGRITITAKDMLLREVLETMSKQSGYPIQKSGFEADSVKVNFSCKEAPFMHALAELCQQQGWAPQETMGGNGMFMNLDQSRTGGPIRKYAVKGPFLLSWHGKKETSSYNFEDPKNPVKTVRYWLDFQKDPLSHANFTLDNIALRDRAVTFLVGSRTEVLNADHKPNVFTSGTPAWQFKPEKLSFPKASITVEIPFCAPKQVSEGRIPWQKDATAMAGPAKVTVTEIKSRTEKKFHPKKFGEWLEFTRYEATIRFIHKDAKTSGVKLSFGQQPSDDERKVLESLILDRHTAGAILDDGKTINAELSGASGMSSPVHGYGARVIAEVEGTAKPQTIIFSCAHGFASGTISMQLDDVQIEE